MFTLHRLPTFSGRAQALFVLCFLCFSTCLTAQTSFSVETIPAQFQDGDSIDLVYDASSETSLHEIHFVHELQGWQLAEGFDPEIDLGQSWFCQDGRCTIQVLPAVSADSIVISITRPVAYPIAGSGEILRLKGIEVMIEEVWLRKSAPSSEVVRMYPNPITDFLMIETATSRAVAQVILQDNLGRLIWTKSLPPGVHKLPVTDLPNGLYQATILIEGSSPQVYSVFKTD